jgi:chemotaxis signal transduction protein
MNHAPVSRSAKRKPRRNEPVILFSVASASFAIAASSVHEIRSTDSLAGSAAEIEAPGVRKVRHTIERSGKTYYVVNAGMHFSLPITRPALVLVLRDSLSAVLIDCIEEMAEISTLHALPRAFCGAERHWYRGLAVLGERVVPVVHSGGFLTPQELSLLEAARPADSSLANAGIEGVASA